MHNRVEGDIKGRNAYEKEPRQSLLRRGERAPTFQGVEVPASGKRLVYLLAAGALKGWAGMDPKQCFRDHTPADLTSRYQQGEEARHYH